MGSIDDATCFESVRQMRWAKGVSFLECKSKQVNKRGFDEAQLQRQRYQRKDCQKNFNLGQLHGRETRPCN
jgi:transposase-like protein